MNAEVSRYYDDLSTNGPLQERMQRLAEDPTEPPTALDKDQMYDRVVAFANAEGYCFTKSDLISFEESIPNPIADASQTEEAAGCHYYFNPPPPTPFPPDFPPWFDPGAVCSIGGYKKCSAGDHKCACFFGGGGQKDSYKMFVCCVVVGYLV